MLEKKILTEQKTFVKMIFLVPCKKAIPPYHPWIEITNGGKVTTPLRGLTFDLPMHCDMGGRGGVHVGGVHVFPHYAGEVARVTC